MSLWLSQFSQHDPEEWPEEMVIKIPVIALSALVNSIAIAKWVACDHDGVAKPNFSITVQLMEQLIYEQLYHSAGADEIWRDPEDGSFQHPSFPEQEGAAWDAVQVYNEEVFRMRLVELIPRLMAEQEGLTGEEMVERVDYYESYLLDIAEQEGGEGVIRALVSRMVS